MPLLSALLLIYIFKGKNEEAMKELEIVTKTDEKNAHKEEMNGKRKDAGTDSTQKTKKVFTFCFFSFKAQRQLKMSFFHPTPIINKTLNFDFII